jgi:ATP-dependent DNA ligase
MLRMRTLPAGFIAPCLPTKASTPPSGGLWVHEIKHDGYRLMARRDSVGVRLLTHNGYDWAPRYPLIVEAFDDTLAEVLESSQARPPCYIGFCPGSPPTSLSWS